MDFRKVLNAGAMVISALLAVAGAKDAVKDVVQKEKPVDSNSENQ